MKTAVQELIEEIQYWKEKAPLGSAFKDALVILEGSAANKLQIEKEQSIEFAMFMYEAVSQKNGVPNNLIQSSKRVFESQFDKTYNQNK